MSGFGYEIVHTLIVDIEPDPKVKAAMNEINAGEYLANKPQSELWECSPFGLAALGQSMEV